MVFVDIEVENDVLLDTFDEVAEGHSNMFEEQEDPTPRESLYDLLKSSFPLGVNCIPKFPSFPVFKKPP